MGRVRLHSFAIEAGWLLSPTYVSQLALVHGRLRDWFRLVRLHSTSSPLLGGLCAIAREATKDVHNLFETDAL